MTNPDIAPTSFYFSAFDGLKLHVREYGPRASAMPPVVCLPGLTRTAEDFDVLARTLAARGRRVLALDSRGRGLSAHDRNPENYSIPVELSDLNSMLAARDAQPAIFFGSSRGGLLTMVLAATNPGSIAGAIFNDIGPVIEHRGLMRIKSYVGKSPLPKNFEEGAEVLRRLFSQQFPDLTPEQWLAWAKRAWREDKKGMAPTYDVKIATTLASINPETTPPPLWPQFDALRNFPLLVIRGEHSDILSAETIAAMAGRRDDMETITIANQGHTPLIDDELTIGRVAAFVDRCVPRGAQH
jgi:pimeloyl-ACP methyl ester carboxylesterase